MGENDNLDHPNDTISSINNDHKTITDKTQHSEFTNHIPASRVTTNWDLTDIVYSEIPDKYKSFLAVEIEPEDLVTIKKQITIKGFNKLTKKVFINNKPVRCDNKGFFSQTIQLKDYGKQHVYVVFTTSDHKIICLEKKVNRLFEPKNKNSNIAFKQIETLFFNTDLIDNPKDKTVFDYIKRSDLAYFLYQLYAVKKSTTNISLTPTSNNKVELAIDYVIEKEWMGLYPDNHFYPNNNVTTVECLISIVRATEKTLAFTNNNINYEDFNKHHWAAPYIKKAQDINLIGAEKKLNPNSLVSFRKLILLIKNLQEVNKKIEDVKNLTINNPRILENIRMSIKSAQISINQAKNDQINQTIFFLEPYNNNEIVFEKHITLNGSIKPVIPFLFQEKTITPSIIGDFVVPLTLEEGLNTFDITINNVTSNYKLFFLRGHVDLRTHWLKTTAAKLKYLNYIDNTPTFNPTQHITRQDFIRYTYPFIENYITKNRSILDEMKSTPNLNIAMATNNNNLRIFEEKIMSFNVTSDEQVTSKNLLTRSEAISLLIQLKSSYITPKENKRKNKPFPFWDVPKTHWARDDIQAAYNQNLLAKAHSFKPDELITKDQLIALLSKDKQVVFAINKAFLND